MIMDFSAMPLQHAAHFRGGEGEVLIRMYNDQMGKISRLELPAGASIGMHTHTTNCEVMVIVSGHGLLLDGSESGKPVSAGMCCYCPQGESHSLINNGTEPLVLMAVMPDLA